MVVDTMGSAVESPLDTLVPFCCFVVFWQLAGAKHGNPLLNAVHSGSTAR